MGSGNPIWRRQWRAFRRNRRGFWSLGLFLVLFVVSLGAEFVANDRPIMVQYQVLRDIMIFLLPFALPRQTKWFTECPMMFLLKRARLCRLIVVL